ncbi:Hypothetical predicted protein [Paramuricea clavata]|uniref:Uncharacterized protein n=1 Tax=Paramuricea clavata TaxID=317549 RepID=A0A6S7KAB1_PARCT|nr:Hypothetical predicted protein [Paramuricea clavata]
MEGYRFYRNILHQFTKVRLKVKMSAIINGIINSTVGLLCSKLRDYTAERLNEGDLNDEKFRQVVVRELDDIKSKLDGLSRKDLLASLSFFKEGVTRFYISLETSGEFRDQPSTSKAHLEDESEVEGAIATRVEQFPVTQAERDVLESVFELSEIIGNLKIASEERYKSAKKSLEKARELATEAFNNVALNAEDRLMASKLRIASRILEGLEDPEAAVHDCLLYLKELQDLPAVQAMFSVCRNSDKGIASRLRARFYKEERNVNVESIQMINALLIDLTLKFTNIKMGLYNWPTIKIGKDFHHPLLENHALRGKSEEKITQLTWCSDWKFDERIDNDVCALTSKGEILSRVWNNGSLKLTRRSGEHQLFCTIPSTICCFSVDKNDNVYIVAEIPSLNSPPGYKLLTLDSDGNVKADRLLDVIDEKLLFPQMNVTKDGMIVIYCRRSGTMYICDSTNTKQDYKFPFLFKDTHYLVYDCSFTVSNKNEIIFTFRNPGEKLVLYIITIDGKLKRKVQVPVENYWEHNKARFHVLSVVFNHVNETILASFYNGLANAPTTIFCFSNTGELLHGFNIVGEYRQLLSHHANRHILLVNKKQAIVFQM